MNRDMQNFKSHEIDGYTIRPGNGGASVWKNKKCINAFTFEHEWFYDVDGKKTKVPPEIKAYVESLCSLTK